MTKAELIEAVAKSANVTKADAERVVECFFSTVTAAARGGDKAAWPGFGHFTVTQTAARETRNPATGGMVSVPARNKMKFTAAAALKATLNPNEK
jgi:DNA-binding protein HU-beta